MKLSLLKLAEKELIEWMKAAFFSLSLNWMDAEMIPNFSSSPSSISLNSAKFEIFIFTTCILTLACLYIIYSNQQITLILNFYSIVVLLFLNFFSINDIYLLSFFIGLIYSGALVISFLFTFMILDVNLFNLRNNLCLISFGFFMNQQVYNSFSFLIFNFSLSFLFNLRKIKQYYKDIMYELFFISFNLNNSFNSFMIDLLLVYFLYFQWWSFLSIPLNDYDMQVVAEVFYHDYNGLLWLIAFYFWSILYWLTSIHESLQLTTLFITGW